MSVKKAILDAINTAPEALLESELVITAVVVPALVSSFEAKAGKETTLSLLDKLEICIKQQRARIQGEA